MGHPNFRTVILILRQRPNPARHYREGLRAGSLKKLGGFAASKKTFANDYDAVNSRLSRRRAQATSALRARGGAARHADDGHDLGRDTHIASAAELGSACNGDDADQPRQIA
jgi:hypothetical protein